MALSKEIMALQKTFAAGEVIFSEDDLTRDLYVLLKGRVEVIQKGIKLAELDKPATFFGEMALLSGQPRSATLRASEDASMLKVPPDKLPLLIQNMPDLAMRMAKNLAEMVRNQNRELLKARDAVALSELLKREIESSPRSTVEEALPRLYQQVRQQQHESMMEVAKSYLQSQVFIEPFLHSIEKSLEVFFNHAIQVKIDLNKEAPVHERVCGIDFQGAMAGAFLFMASNEALKGIGAKLFGSEAKPNMENDTIMELAKRIIDKVKTDVPGLHLEISLPEMMENLATGEDFLGLKMKTDVGFAAWVHLNK